VDPSSAFLPDDTRCRRTTKKMYRPVPISVDMKIEAVITGRYVHDVGYRIYLLHKALTEGIEGFFAMNTMNPENLQQVIVQAEGDEESIQAFSQFIRNEKPHSADVTSVTIHPYEKRVIRIMDYMHLVNVEQLDKGIPAILSIRSTQEKMLERQDLMIEKQDQMLDRQDTTIQEISGLRSDLKNEMNIRFTRIEHELEVIKDALHRSGIAV
jgi:acylphosphatase